LNFRNRATKPFRSGLTEKIATTTTVLFLVQNRCRALPGGGEADAEREKAGQDAGAQVQVPQEVHRSS